ncbi:MAG TPA: ABC transporter ATP-binding protein [Ilumatobacteraceae bacterium]|nr:ABC transporter ATP-binding protein [Ilumatobacteraceae bacterium]
MPVIEVADLTKSYGHVHALRGISFAVEKGECLAVLGPNGAGKTTTVEILEGYRTRDSGTVTVLGMDPAHGGTELRQRIGIVLQECGVEPYLTVTEVLTMHAGYYRHPLAVADVIHVVGLDEKAKARVKSLSGGQKRRLDVALGLIPDPELLFLDEPTTGFDPAARRQAWEMIKSLHQFGKTVLLTTHYMDEAQALADRVIVIAEGEIVAQGPPESIGGRADAAAEIRFLLPANVTVDQLPIAAEGTGDGAVLVTTPTPTEALRILTSWAAEHGGELAQLTVTRPSLDDIYVALTSNVDEARP